MDRLTDAFRFTLVPMTGGVAALRVGPDELVSLVAPECTFILVE